MPIDKQTATTTAAAAVLRMNFIAYPPIGAHLFDKLFDAFKCDTFNNLSAGIEVIKVGIWF